MPTELKSATARANGAKSNGPKSAATREISSRNSIRHGFTARNTVLLKCEDPALYEHVRNEYIATYQPVTAAETDLVDEMVVARWRIQRLWTIETALIDSEMIRQAETEKQSFGDDPGVQLAVAFRALTDESRAIATLSRYESRLHRIHDRAYRTLRQLQQDRKAPAEPEAPLPPPATQESPNPLQPRPISPAAGRKKNCESNPGGAGRSPAVGLWPTLAAIRNASTQLIL